MKRTLLILPLFILFIGCNSKQNDDLELYDLVQLITGHFSTQEQSEKEIGYSNLNLINTLIWEEKPGYWAYLEIHDAKDPSIIHIQRVVNIKRLDSTTFSSTSYIIPNSKAYIHAWKDKTIFNKLNIESLELRDGCDLYYKKKTSSIFVGKTNNQSCLSRIKSVAYTASNVVVSSDKISIWDKGYEVGGKQVWGKIKGPYKYKKIAN